MPANLIILVQRFNLFCVQDVSVWWMHSDDTGIVVRLLLDSGGSSMFCSLRRVVSFRGVVTGHLESP